MRKRLRNPSSNRIVRVRGRINITLGPGEEYDVQIEELDEFINCCHLTKAIEKGRIEVGDEDKFYTDPLEGEAYFKTTYGGNAYIIEGSSLDRYTPEVITDSATGKKGTSMFMGYLGLLKEMYNDSGDPLYEADFQPLLGAGGRELEHINRTNNLENIHSAVGWHQREIDKAIYEKPKDVLFYYGWLNSFNYNINGWSNEQVANDMAKYSIIVLGDGIADPLHADYANSQIIVARIKVLNPEALVFGYVSINQSYVDFTAKVDDWEALEVSGIFLDEAGYDYGDVSTNGRDAFNTKVDYVHGQTYAKLCFVNSWNMDHIIGVVNDPTYPNTTWNTSTNISNLTYLDWYLLESFPVHTTSYANDYEPKADWLSRGTKAYTHRYNYGIHICGVSVIDNGTVDGQDMFQFSYISSCMFALDAIGSSDTFYGSSSSTVNYWYRPNVSELGKLRDISPSIVVATDDSDLYLRLLSYGRLELDFSIGNEFSKIVRYTANTVPVWEDRIHKVDYYVYDSMKLKLDSTGGSFTIYLPAEPKGYMEIYFLDIADMCSTNNVIVNPNGNTIMGSSSNMTISTDSANFSLVWANDWRVRD